MTRWNVPEESLRDEDLVSLVKTMSMGISEKEMKDFLQQAPRASMSVFADALEFTAALKQSGLNSEATRDIVFSGLEKGYFSRSSWHLALAVKAAKSLNIADEHIKMVALEVVSGDKTIQEARKALGVDRKDLKWGPQIIPPRSGIPAKGPTTEGDKGYSGASEQEGAGRSSGGTGESDGAGSHHGGHGGGPSDDGGGGGAGSGGNGHGGRDSTGGSGNSIGSGERHK
jgi:hypothetical protein